MEDFESLADSTGDTHATSYAVSRSLLISCNSATI